MAKTYRGVQLSAVADQRTRHQLAIIDEFLLDLSNTAGNLQKGQSPATSGPTTSGITSHHLLQDLTTYDDHPQYLYLLGRTGGQTALGGPGTASFSTDKLILAAYSYSGATISNFPAKVTLSQDATFECDNLTIAERNDGGGLPAVKFATGSASTQLSALTGFANATHYGSYNLRGTSTGASPILLIEGWNQGLTGANVRIVPRLAVNTAQTGPLAEFYGTDNTRKSYIDIDGSWNGPVNATSGTGAGWTDDGTVVRLTTATDHVSIGTATDLSAMLGILAPASGIGSAIKYTSGTVDLSQWQDASGVKKFSVSSDIGPVLANLIYLRGRNAADSVNLPLMAIDGSNDATVAGSSVNNIHFKPANTEIVRIRGDANVGMTVGDSTAPAALLYVKSQATGRTTLRLDAIAGQTANILEIYDTAGVLQQTIDKTGYFQSPNYNTDGPATGLNCSLISADTDIFLSLNSTTGGGAMQFQMQGAIPAGGNVLAFPNTAGTLLNSTNSTTVGAKTLTVTNIVRCNTATGVTFQDNSTTTKQMRFDLSGITAANTRNQKWLDLTGVVPTVGKTGTAAASGTLAGIDTVNTTPATVAATNLTNTAAAGMYKVIYEMCVTTADGTAGTLGLTIAWTDDLGATSQIPAAMALTATGRATGDYVCYLASGNITYALALTGIAATSKYYLRIRTMALN
jgi:hypothetical protein